MTPALHFAIRSDVGLLREGNEDAAYAGPRVVAVADGMGGHAAGEVASRLAIASIAALDDADLALDSEPDALAALAAAVERAQRDIRQRVSGDSALEGMGTTLTALLWTGNGLGLAHVGDSRAYLLRDGTLERITHDHTYVQELVDSDQITADDAQTHPQRSLLTRALDGRSSAQPDLTLLEVRVGDRYLLCSDGLCGVVRDATLASTLAVPDIDEAADRLVDLALRAGGPDNITVVVCEIEDRTERHAGPVLVGAAADVALPSRGGDTPAERAATTGAQTRRWRRAPRRPAWALAALALVVAVAAAGGWLWTQRQYFVGMHGDHVAIFRGVAWSIGGLSLHSVSEPVNIDPSRLPDFERERLRAGIVAATLPKARHIADRLAVEQCQPQVTAARSTGASPTGASSTGGGATASPAAGGTPGSTIAPTPTAGGVSSSCSSPAK